MLTIEKIFSHIDQHTAEATLQGSKGELLQLRKVADFLSLVADEAGDRPAAERASRINAIVTDAINRLEH